MTGRQWATAITLAQYAHGRDPTLDQVCVIAERCFPWQWRLPCRRPLLHLTGRFHLSQAMQLAAYRRETATELREREVEATAMFGAPDDEFAEICMLLDLATQ